MLVPSGASFGDPHIITFDAVEYTFNGFGEYTVLSVNNSQFVLQGRMQPLNGGHNGKSPATVFTAFAMKQQGGSLIQVSHYAPYCKSDSVPIAEKKNVFRHTQELVWTSWNNNYFFKMMIKH